MRRIKASSFLFVALAGLVMPDVGRAKDGVTTRPLSDFLDAQGSQGSNFFPPVPDYVGWADGAFVYFALIDYAGLAADYIEGEDGPDLGTTFSGQVLQRENEDGSAEITVILHTKNALAFAQSIQALIDNGFDFLDTPTCFGAKAQDVVAGTDDPSTGWAQLKLTFTIAAPGAPLPDLLELFPGDIVPEQYAPLSFDFKSQSIGELSGGPCDGLDAQAGTPARLFVHQAASVGEGGGPLAYTAEDIEIQVLGPY